MKINYSKALNIGTSGNRLFSKIVCEKYYKLVEVTEMNSPKLRSVLLGDGVRKYLGDKSPTNFTHIQVHPCLLIGV